MRKQTGYDFFYNRKDVPLQRRIDFNLRDVTLYTAVTYALSGLGLDFSVEDNIIVISRQTPRKVVPPAEGQKIEVTGQILDEHNKPMANATVAIKRSRSVYQSDAQGQFRIPDAPEDAILQVAYLGYQTLEIPLKGKTMPVQIRLNIQAGELEEVSINYNTGFQSLPKERATGSFSFIDKETIGRNVGLNVLDRIEGLAPSVFFDRRMAETKIQIRGLSTLFSNAQPLIILDKFPYAGDINSINPDDIESITILRDAAATSVWGARAGNGVIVLTSKKGKLNQEARVSFSSRLQLQNKPDLYGAPLVDAQTAIEIERNAFNLGVMNSFINSASKPKLSPVIDALLLARRGEISAAEADARLSALAGNDIRQEFLQHVYRVGLVQGNNLSFDIGSRINALRLNAGYDQVYSTFKGNSSKRATLAVSNTIKASESLSIEVGLNYTNQSDKPNELKENMRSFSRFDRFADQAGNPLPVDLKYEGSFLDTVGKGQLLDWKYRPLQEMAANNYTTTLHNVLGSLSVNYKLFKLFTLNVSGQVQRTFQQEKIVRGLENYYTRDQINLFTNLKAANYQARYPVPIGGILTDTREEVTGYGIRPQLNFDYAWGNKHTVAALAGAEIGQTGRDNSAQMSYGFSDRLLSSPVDYVNPYSTYFNGSARIASQSSYRKRLDRTMTAFANASYTYDNKYTLSASLRKDASNIYGVNANRKGSPFWHAGASWKISEEDFYAITFLPVLKLRATYGRAGNTNSAASALTIINILQGAVGLPVGSISTYPNPDLAWEKVTTTNLGVEFGLKGARLNGSVEYYQKRSTDLYGDQPLDPTTGRFRMLTNIADMAGSGFDISLSSKNFTGAFSWTTGVNMSLTTNKITHYPKGPFVGTATPSTGFIIEAMEGRNPYELISYRWGGLDPATGAPRGYVNGRLYSNPDSLRYATESDLVFHGSNIPKAFGNLRNDFSYKGFSLSFNIITRLGWAFRKPSYDGNFPVNGDQLHGDYLSRWQKAGDETFTQIPATGNSLGDVNRSKMYLLSELLVHRGDYIKWSDARLSYQFLPALTKRLGMRQFSAFLLASNLNIILWRANKLGLDPDFPEVNRPAKQFAAGLSLVL